MSDLREEFENFIEQDFPSAFANKNKHSIKTWVDFAFSCYLEGTKQANIKSLELIKMLEKRTL